MKFEFELDDIDTENLFYIFQSHKLKLCEKMLDTEGDESKWYKTHIQYIDELEGLVFSREPRYTFPLEDNETSDT